MPTEYRMNTIHGVSRHFERAGFSRVELRMWDLPRLYQPYLPGPLDRFPAAWNRAAYALDRPGLMGHLSVRAVR